METPKALEILKQAILLEKRGYSFYSTVAAQCQDEDVKNIFLAMANEETAHVKFLSEQFAHYDKTHSFLKVNLTEGMDDTADHILSDEVKKKISAAGFEAAAIGAAVDFEKRAIEIYANRAAETEDPNEKELYTFLSNWEKTHLKILSDLDNELKEKIWNDNQFWPF